MKRLRRSALFILLLLAVAGAAWAQEDIPTGVTLGEPLPALSGVDLSENPVTLEGVVGKRTVVLSFWSIYCSDCVRELDDLRSIRAEFPADEVSIVAVNTDSGLPISRIASFVRRYEGARGSALDVVHLLDRDEAIVKALGIRYIPLMVTLNRAGDVANVISGYDQDSDRERLVQALDEGRVALGAWSEGLSGRLRTILRGSGPDGKPVEFGTFRVEEGMSLFGLHDANGWLVDPAGRLDREFETGRVEQVVADRLKISLMRDALGSVGFRIAPIRHETHTAQGTVIPESPFDYENKWRRLYEELNFDNLVQLEQKMQGQWVGDEYWAGMLGSVDLGRLRGRLQGLGIPTETMTIRLITTSDFDYKPRVMLKQLQQSSYRVQSFQDDRIVYYGDCETLGDELGAMAVEGMTIFVEKLDKETLRVEVL